MPQKKQKSSAQPAAAKNRKTITLRIPRGIFRMFPAALLAVALPLLVCIVASVWTYFSLSSNPWLTDYVWTDALVAARDFWALGYTAPLYIQSWVTTISIPPLLLTLIYVRLGASLAKMLLGNRSLSALWYYPLFQTLLALAVSGFLTRSYSLTWLALGAFSCGILSSIWAFYLIDCENRRREWLEEAYDELLSKRANQIHLTAVNAEEKKTAAQPGENFSAQEAIARGYEEAKRGINRRWAFWSRKQPRAKAGMGAGGAMGAGGRSKPSAAKFGAFTRVKFYVQVRVKRVQKFLASLLHLDYAYREDLACSRDGNDRGSRGWESRTNYWQISGWVVDGFYAAWYWFRFLAVALLGLLAVRLWYVWDVFNAQMQNIAGVGDKRVGLGVLQLLFVPNAQVWALGWATGSGFSVGENTFYSFHQVQEGVLPAIPALALLPTRAVGDWVVLIPIAFSLIAGYFFYQRRGRVSFAQYLASQLLTGAIFVGLIAMCTAAAAGSLGPGRMSVWGSHTGWMALWSLVEFVLPFMFVALMLHPKVWALLGFKDKTALLGQEEEPMRSALSVAHSTQKSKKDKGRFSLRVHQKPMSQPEPNPEEADEVPDGDRTGQGACGQPQEEAGDSAMRRDAGVNASGEQEQAEGQISSSQPYIAIAVDEEHEENTDPAGREQLLNDMWDAPPAAQAPRRIPAQTAPRKVEDLPDTGDLPAQRAQDTADEKIPSGGPNPVPAVAQGPRRIARVKTGRGEVTETDTSGEFKQISVDNTVSGEMMRPPVKRSVFKPNRLQVGQAQPDADVRHTQALPTLPPSQD